MKIFDIQHYEDKIEELGRLAEIADYHSGGESCHSATESKNLQTESGTSYR